MPATQLVSVVKGATRKLVCLVSGMDGEKWSAAAVETGIDVDTAQGALDDHGHKLIGSFSTVVKALAACEDYARRWVRNQEGIDPCGCEDIPPPGPSPMDPRDGGVAPARPPGTIAEGAQRSPSCQPQVRPPSGK